MEDKRLQQITMFMVGQLIGFTLVAIVLMCTNIL